MYTPKIISLFVLLCFSLTTIAQEQKMLTKQEKKQMASFSKIFTGLYDNLEYAAKDKTGQVQDQELRAFRIWKDKEGAHWFYIGWFTPLIPEQPLADGLFKIYPAENGELEMQLYHAPEAYKYSLPWEMDKPFEDLVESELISGSCTGIIKGDKKKGYVLKTSVDCKLKDKSSGLHFIEIHLEYNKKGVVSYSNFFDKDAKFVFGFPNGHVFKLKSRKQ